MMALLPDITQNKDFHGFFFQIANRKNYADHDPGIVSGRLRVRLRAEEVYFLNQKKICILTPFCNPN